MPPMTMTSRFREYMDSRRTYCGRGRAPFYLLAGRYLPDDPDAVVVDVGAGTGDFADLLDLANRYRNLHLLDGNRATVQELAGRFAGATHQVCPDPLPFADGTVDFLHSSHLIEHLDGSALLAFLGQCDRVLRPGGVLVMSAPLLWDLFYEDVSHVKPYTPGIFSSYLCGGGGQRSAGAVSEMYCVEELVYRNRFTRSSYIEGAGHRVIAVDLAVQACRKLAGYLGFGTYERTGYTIVLRKVATDPMQP